MREPLLTTADVARWLNVSADFVRDHKADLAARRVGHELRFEPAAVRAWLDSQAVEREAPAARKRRRPGPKRGTAGVPLLPLPMEAR